jgi:hypothetical protein
MSSAIFREPVKQIVCRPLRMKWTSRFFASAWVDELSFLTPKGFTMRKYFRPEGAPFCDTCRKSRPARSAANSRGLASVAVERTNRGSAP